MFWRRDQGKKKYLHICQYGQKTEGDDGEADGDAGDGMLRDVKKNVKKVQGYVENSHEKNMALFNTHLEAVKKTMEEVKTSVTNIDAVETSVKDEITTVQSHFVDEVKKMNAKKDLLAKNLSDYQNKISSLFDKLNGDVKEEDKSGEAKQENEDEIKK